MQTQCAFRGAAVGMLIAVSLMATPAALADTMRDCRNTAEPARALVACSTVIIEAGKDPAKLAEGYALRSAANEASGDLKAALDDIFSATIRDSNNPQLWYRSGTLRAALKQPIRASADFTIALRYDPWMTDALIRRGTEQRVLGLLTRAIEDFDAAIKLDPKSAPAFAGRAYTHLRNGKPDLALGDAEEALKLDPTSVFGHLTMGLVAEGQKDKDKAMASLKKALDLDPKNVVAAEALKRVGG